MAVGDPEDVLNITQPTWPLLDVGFEVVGGVIVFAEAGLLLIAFGDKEGAAGPEVILLGGVLQLVEIGLTADQQTRLQQVGGDGDILLSLIYTALDGAHAMTNL